MISKTATIILSVSLIFWLSTQSCFAAKSPETLTMEDMSAMNKPFTGDFPEMAENHIIRVLMPYSKTFFFFDGAAPKGLSYEVAQRFEEFVNKKMKTGARKIKVFVLPTAREKLLPNLKKGLGDLAIGNLTITKKRLNEVDFADPMAKDVTEILVSIKKDQEFTSIFDLSGKSIHARKSSSYYQSLVKLNETLKSLKKPQIKIIIADDQLEDEDLLEMVNAELIEYIIIDDHKGEFWVRIFDNIMLHPEVKVRTGAKIAWALRKNNPKLKAVINEFAKQNKAGTLIGNVMINKYLKNTKYITNSVANEHMNRFKLTVRFFEKYGKQYNFDYLMLAALAYQESKLNQNLKSHAGAVGVMQILPSTAKDKNVGIPDIYELDPNIHAGTKYLRFMTDNYFAGDENLTPLDKTFFTFASYNAGPARVARMRRDAEKMGFDPNVWFGNVEVVAAKQIGRETVQYVSNIFKYYIAYKLLEHKFDLQGPVHLSDPPRKKMKNGK